MNLSDLNNAGVDQQDRTATWQQVAASGRQAHSISPDALGGWDGHPYGTVAPYPVWSWDGSNSVTWNSAGNVYGCWF